MKLKKAAARIVWTDARVAVLKRLRSEGASCSQIAAELGDVSRCAVIGKIHRLRLPPPANAPQPARHRETACDKRVAPLLAVAPPATRKSARPGSTITTLDQFNVAIPIGQRRALQQLTRATCRWPVGEPDKPGFFFCGGRIEEGRPYCAGHCVFAYQQGNRPCRRSKHATAKPTARLSRLFARA